MVSSSAGTAVGRKPNSRNWADLPDDITAAILSRVGAVDVLENAQKVCMKWRRISKDPLTWRTIDFRNDCDPYSDHDGDLDEDQLETMCRHAVDLSRGGLVDINIENFGTDELLEYIAQRSSGIKRLRLANCEEMSEEGFMKVAPKLTMLENLELSLCPVWHNAIGVVGRACPRLISFKLNRDYHEEMGYEVGYYSSDDDGPFARHEYTDMEFDRDGEPYFRSKPNEPDNSDALAVAKTMPNLRHLQLFGNKIGNHGLSQILESCPHLESLDLRQCFSLDLSGDLGRICREQIRNLLLPSDFVADYPYRRSADQDHDNDDYDDSIARSLYDPYSNDDASYSDGDDDPYSDDDDDDDDPYFCG